MKAIVGRLPDGAVGIIVWPPVECRCGRMAAHLVNREGETRCLRCDTNELERSRETSRPEARRGRAR